MTTSALTPRLDARLAAVLELIRAETHADIGADHAHLPIRLVQSGRVARCVVVELHGTPLRHARQNVARAGLSDRIAVRQGDGFGPLGAGEVQSASITGMGARTILGILERAGDALCPELVLQPNDSPLPLRQWARYAGFHVVAEVLAPGFWAYPVIALSKRPGPDPAYDGLPLAAALRYGPQLLRQAPPELMAQLEADLTRLRPLALPGRRAQEDWEVAEAAWAYLDAQGAVRKLPDQP